MTTRHYTTELSDYLDGELAAEERGELEAHLASCRECADALAQLRAVVSAAGELPDLPPERDLWPGIAARLSPRDTGRERDQLIALRRRRHVVMTVPQLIAAAIALILFSASAVWLTVAGTADSGSDPIMMTSDPMPTMVAFTDVDRTIVSLEEEYLSRRDELDPETIRVVERNLAIIDQAIAEARQALAEDPSSGFLSSHLAGAMQRKMDLLRQATVIAQSEI